MSSCLCVPSPTTLAPSRAILGRIQVIVSRMRYVAAQTGGCPVRFVGLSTALANAQVCRLTPWGRPRLALPASPLGGAAELSNLHAREEGRSVFILSFHGPMLPKRPVRTWRTGWASGRRDCSTSSPPCGPCHSSAISRCARGGKPLA